MGWGDGAIAFLLGTVIIIVAAQVVFHYVLNHSLTWSEEASRYLFSWINVLGAALAIKDDSHLRVNILLDYLPSKVARCLRLFTGFLVAGFLALMTILGFMLLSRTANTRSPALSLPINYVYYASLPVTTLIGIYYVCRKIVRRLTLKDRGPAREIK